MKKLHAELVQQIDLLPITYSDKQVLRFIAARTIRYDKVEEVIPERHFLEGLNGTRACGVPRATLKRSQLRLAQAGFIRVIHHRGDFGDKANSYEIQLNAIKDNAVVSKLKVSRKRKTPDSMRGLRVRPGGSQSETPEVDLPSEDNLEVEINLSRQRPATSSASSRRELGEKVEQAKAKTVSARRRKAGKLSKTKTVSGLRAAWLQACADAYPDERPTPVSEKMAGRFISQTVNYLPDGQDLIEFVSWAVGHWDHIRAHFAWMKKPKVPLAPDLHWCSHHCARLLVSRKEITLAAQKGEVLSDQYKLRLENQRLQGELAKARQKSLRPDFTEADAKAKATYGKPGRPPMDFDMRMDEIPDLPPCPYGSDK